MTYGEPTSIYENEMELRVCNTMSELPWESHMFALCWGEKECKIQRLLLVDR